MERHERRPEPAGRTGRAGRPSDDKGLGLPTSSQALGRLGRSSEQAVGLPALPSSADEVGRPKSQQNQASPRSPQSPRSLNDALAADAERSCEQDTACQRPGDTGPCPACGYRAVWRVTAWPWRCCRCEPCEAAANPGAVFDYRLPQPGDASCCRHCGEPMGWPRPVGLTLGDGTALHHRCAELFEVDRVKSRAANALTPAALVDEAELTARGEVLP